MKINNILAGCFIVLVAVLLNVQPALAHETVTVGDYEIEFGWLNEPPIVGSQNAIVVNVFNTSSGEEEPVEDVSSLTVAISYGGQDKMLTLQPLGEDTPGQFVAPVVPTVAGEYTLIFGGKLGDTDVNDVQAHPEEVQSADILQFPKVESANQSAGTGNWLAGLGILIGLIGVGVGVTALRKVSMR
jgi:hypothetical protein